MEVERGLQIGDDMHECRGMSRGKVGYTTIGVRRGKDDNDVIKQDSYRCEE